MADDDGEPFYEAYGKISSRFGADDGDQLAEELTAADIGPDGPNSASAKVKTSPTATHRLTLFIERCTAPRPTTSLKGTTERYEDACSNLEAAFLEKFADGQWSAEQIDFSANPSPDKSPFTYLPAEEAARYTGRLGTLAAPTYLQEMGGTTRQALLQGRMVIDMGIYPPQLVKYPRIGALEVTYQLTDQGKPIGQKLAFSKLATGKWPNVQALMKKIHLYVMLDLHKQRLNFASHARRSKALAEQQREYVAQAEEAAAREQREYEVAMGELNQAESELHQARETGEGDAAIATLEAALAKMRARVDAELREAREATKALNATIVKQAETLARAEVSEARLAMQEARKELNEWEVSQVELEVALKSIESLTRMGDSTGAAAMRLHANRLREVSDKELAEVRAANVTATTELIEAVVSLHKAAEAKLAACDAEASEDSDTATGHGRRTSRFSAASRARFNALKAINEAKVQIEDAEAQAAMTTADLEFREATSFVLQARLALSEAKHATEGDAQAAREKAAALQKRADDEIADARASLEKAATEAVEAAEARNAKEIAEAEQTREELARAEAALEAAKTESMRTGADNGVEVDEITAEIELLRRLVERESKDLVAAALNVEMTRSELDAKRATIEQSLSNAAVAARALEKAQQAEAAVAAAADKELQEAEVAETRLAHLESDLQAAEEEAASTALRAEELVRQRGPKHSAAKAALQAESEAQRKVDWLKRQLEDAEIAAQRERLEADEAMVKKEEVEAELAFERYQKIVDQMTSTRDRLQGALDNAEKAQASGERGLEERATEAANKLQDELDQLTDQAKAELDTATREQEEASEMRERIETRQAQDAERISARSVKAMADAEAAATAAVQELVRFKGRDGAELQRLTAQVELKENKAEMARARSADARARLETEREEAAESTVSRSQKMAEFALLRHELAAEFVLTLELRVSAASRKATHANEAGHVILSKTFEGQVLDLEKRLKDAQLEAVTQSKKAALAEAAAVAALRNKEVQQAHEYDLAAVEAEAAATQAEAEAEKAAAALSALTKGSGRAEAEQAKEQAEIKAARLRAEAKRVRAQADKEEADVAALDAAEAAAKETAATNTAA